MSLHHSFDTSLAEKYGIEEAILIHHFQHWISYNKRLARNHIDGRTWTYQTLEEIAAHFPYWDKSKVFEIIEHLRLGKNRRSKKDILDFSPVIMKENYNKKRFDRTIWYAFINENDFLGNEESQSPVGICQNENREMPTPIPHTIPHPVPKRSKDLSCPESKKTPPPSADALELCDIFFDSIREMKPDFKKPNMDIWRCEMDRIIRIDKRDPSKIRTMIVWIRKDEFWRNKVLSPDKLRKQYDQIELKMSERKDSYTPEDNKKYALQFDFLSTEFHEINVLNKYVEINPLKGGQPVIIEYNSKDFRDRFDSLLKSTQAKRKMNGEI